MRQKSRCSLRKLVFAAAMLNLPGLWYLFSNEYSEKRQTLLNFQRDGIMSSIWQRNATKLLSGFGDSFAHKNRTTCNSSNGTSVFDNLTEPAPRWLPIDSTAHAHYVFSAFLYKVGDKPTIRVIAAMCQAAKTKIYCELRYREGSGNVSVVMVMGTGKQLPEGTGYKYRAAFFHCRLPDNRVPVTVTIKTSPNMPSLNAVPVRNQEVNPSDRKKFAVCVSPLFGEYNSTTNMVQWIELNRLLGADLFVFYNFSVAKDIDTVLRFYSCKGLVKVIPWDIIKFRPPGRNQEINYAGQTMAINDCLMRVKPVSEFVVNIDLDELLVPHNNLSTWTDIVNKYPYVGIYNFRSSFFRLNWENTDKVFPRKDIAEKYKISFLLKLDHEAKIYPPSDRTKYFAKTDITDSLLVHKIHEKVGSEKSEMFPPEVALIHHYRRIMAKINGVIQPDPSKGPKVFDDTVLRKYRDALIENVLKVNSEMYGEFS